MPTETEVRFKRMFGTEQEKQDAQMLLDSGIFRVISDPVERANHGWALAGQYALEDLGLLDGIDITEEPLIETESTESGQPVGGVVSERYGPLEFHPRTSTAMEEG